MILHFLMLRICLDAWGVMQLYCDFIGSDSLGIFEEFFCDIPLF
jgi:hypothetical protein